MSYKFIQNLVPESKYYIKCPNKMTPEGITVHNTYNDASARNEVSYMISNNNQTSFHIAADDKEIVQGIPLDRNGWHAGDGNGNGNRKTIGIEICYSLSGGSRFVEAEKNAAKYIASLLIKYGWTIKNVYKHQDWSGKYCPHRTLNLGWQRFLDMISAELNNTFVDNKNFSCDAVYRVYANGRWLPAVKNLEDYAGIDKFSIKAFSLKVSKGSVKYRVHQKGGTWLGWCKGYGTSLSSQYAGDKKNDIDAIQIVYTSPEGYKSKVAQYRVSPTNTTGYYDWQDNVTTNKTMDGYAGLYGKPIDKVQVRIV